MRIAIADDDFELLERLTEALAVAGYDFDSFRDGTVLQTALRRETYDVVLLDWNMPGATGFEVVTWAQETLEAPPVFILLTSRTATDDVVQALEAGAGDYIIKPESLRVIIARIEAAYRKRHPTRRAQQEQYGDFTVDHQQGRMLRGGEVVQLTAKEFMVAALFFANLDRPLSREFITSKVWGSSPLVESRTLDVHISRVRTKLGLRPENGFALKTVFAFGYRLDRFEGEEGFAEISGSSLPQDQD